ncbi:putative molybdate-anion transporter, MFS transporter superfamily [Helianthus annuus]|nr:putative molybdate-anion transporter, MFS transporter superfamily [Helianthus annuus]
MFMCSHLYMSPIHQARSMFAPFRGGKKTRARAIGSPENRSIYYLLVDSHDSDPKSRIDLHISSPMGVVIESEVWENNQPLSIFIFVSCLLSVLCLPHNSSRISTVFDQLLPSSLLRFQRNFLLLFCFSSVMEGMWSVFGEYEMAYFGVSKEQMVSSLIIGSASALFLGTGLGMLSDLIGRKKICLMFCVLHLFVAIWKRLFSHPSIWLASVSLSLASSIFLFGFETWMVTEHDKLGHRLDSLNEMFWLMTFLESASLIGSQVVANWLVSNELKKNMFSPSTATALLAVVSIVSIAREWRESPPASIKDYRISLNTHIFSDKRIWLLGWAQSCVQFSVAVFWILWAPTIVADGREVNLGMIYPCLLGAKMLGSTAFPWFINGPLPLRTEDCLVYAFVIAGIVLSIVAYDYQEIGILVGLFCLFHACIGLVLPSLARLRTLYVPNELRGGMISLSLAPANAAILLCLILRGYSGSIENSTIIAFGAIGLFSAAGCMHLLKQSGKHSPHQNFHKH